MKKLLTSVVAALIAVTATSVAVDAKKKPHVVIHKRPAAPCVGPGCGGGGQWKGQPLAALIIVAPPLLLAYDLQRRTNCQGDVLGLGGPGFTSPITPATGNVMTTAVMRGQCGYYQPK